MDEKIVDIDRVVSLLRRGKVGIFPTDTAFGIGCRMDDLSAVKRIFRIRKRPEEKAVLCLVSSIQMARRYVFFDDQALKIAKRYWPGGLTVVLKCKKEKVLSEVRAGGDTLAVRLPDHQELVGVIEEVGVPIIAPSANFSGGKTPLTLDDVQMALVKKVDFVLAGVCTINGVSTIIDATKKPPKIIRQGVVGFV